MPDIYSLDLTITRIHLISCVFFISKVYNTMGLSPTIFSICFFGFISFLTASMAIDIRKSYEKSILRKEKKNLLRKKCKGISSLFGKRKFKLISTRKRVKFNGTEERRNKEKYKKPSEEQEKESFFEKTSKGDLYRNKLKGNNQREESQIRKQSCTQRRKTFPESKKHAEKSKKNEFTGKRKGISYNPFAILQKSFDVPIFRQSSQPNDCNSLETSEISEKGVFMEYPFHPFRTRNNPVRYFKTMNRPSIYKPVEEYLSTSGTDSPDLTKIKVQEINSSENSRTQSTEPKQLHHLSQKKKKFHKRPSRRSEKKRKSHFKSKYNEKNFIIKFEKVKRTTIKSFSVLINKYSKKLGKISTVVNFVLNILGLISCLRMTYEFSQELVKQSIKSGIFILFFCASVIVSRSKPERVSLYESTILILFIFCCFFEYIICIFSSRSGPIEYENNFGILSAILKALNSNRDALSADCKSTEDITKYWFCFESLAFLIWAFNTHSISFNTSKTKILIYHLLSVLVLILLGLMRYFSFLYTLSHYLIYPFVFSRLKIIVLQVITYRKTLCDILDNNFGMINSLNSREKSESTNLFGLKLKKSRSGKIFIFLLKFFLSIILDFKIIKSLFFIFGFIEMYIIVGLLHMKIYKIVPSNIFVLLLGISGCLYGTFLLYKNFPIKEWPSK